MKHTPFMARPGSGPWALPVRAAGFCRARTVLLLVMLAGICPGTVRAAPRMAWAATTFNFGRMEAGKTVRHDFVVTNVGTAVLEITEIRPGCGCTTTGVWDRRVEPGKTGVIPLVFNSAGFSGFVSKAAVVIANDPGRTNLVLVMEGEVWKPIEVTPAQVTFRLPEGTPTNTTQVVRIVSHLDDPLTLSDLVSTNRAFHAELTTVRPGREYELRVTALAPWTAAATADAIRLKTSWPGLPTLSIGVQGMVQANVVVAPEVLSVPAAALSNGTIRTVIVRNYGTNRLAVSEARINVPGAAVTVDEADPGRMFGLRVRFPAGTVLPADQLAVITARTSDPKTPNIRVPVMVIPAGTPAGRPRVSSGNR